MYTPTRGARAIARTLISSLLLTLGCARAPSQPAPEPAAAGPIVAHGVGDGRHVSLEARPSLAAAELLPADASYRAVLAGDGELALVVIGADQRIVGRLHVAAALGPNASPGLRVEFEDQRGRPARVEAWASAGGLHGQAVVGQRSARWRVRVEADGSLAGESWSSRRVGSEAAHELLELRRARVIGADLGALAAQLSSSGAFEIGHECELAELLAFAELALELSIRAWDGRDRAQLPRLAHQDQCG